MHKTYTIIIVLILVAGAIFFSLKSKKLEAPTFMGDNMENTQTSNETPATSETSTTTTVVNTNVTVSTETTAPVKKFTVTGKNFSFTPNMITVKKGDKVKITFKNTQGFHDFVIDGYRAATIQFAAPGEEILEFTADKAGSFEYYCSVGTHRMMGMKGILKVE